MSIVAISQTLGSMGEEIGRELAHVLGYDFADREMILKAADLFGEGVRELEHVTEEKPTLWERFTESRQRYLTYVEAIIWEMAAHDNAVLMGHGAPYALRSVRHALRVRITAPAGHRAKRVENQQGLTSDAATHFVRQNDHERASRIRFLYHVDWDDPLLYDLVINTERLTVKEAVRLVQDALQAEHVRTTPDSLMEVRDLSLTAQAKAMLMADPRTRSFELFLTCREGQLSVRGMLPHAEDRQHVEEVLGRVRGAARVIYEVTVVPPRVARGAV
jgi:cytidylate kinase